MRFKFGIIAILCLFMPCFASALPFNIIPKAGTIFPEQLISGQTASVYYTVTNTTSSQRRNNYIKYLPLNVTQVTTNKGIMDLCGSTFTLQPAHTLGDSCTLQLLISGEVNARDPDPHHHLFACWPGGVTCAGTDFPLNVTLVSLSNVMVAVGSYQDTLSNLALALATTTNNGASWSQQSLSPPAGYQQGNLMAMSCANEACVGVGSYCDTNYCDNVAAIVKSINKGKTWTQQILPLPTECAEEGLLGIYCTGTNCIAGGNCNLFSTGNAQGLIATTLNGTTWRQQLLPYPNGIELEFFAATSCTGNFCIATGGGQHMNSRFFPTIAISPNRGVSWTQSVLPHLPGITDAILNGVSCTASACIAVGDYIDNSFFDHLGIAVSTNQGASWSQQLLVPPASFTEGVLNGISCATNYCVAVGYYTYGVFSSGYPAIIVTTNHGVSWLQQTLTLPPAFRYGFLTGVKCNNNVCNASGYYERLNGDIIPLVAMSQDSGHTWTQQALAPPNSYIAGELSGIG